MITDADRQIAEQLKSRLLASGGGRIRRIILYGSRATGTARADSDFDLLVVESGPVSAQEESDRLREVLRGLPHVVQVWVMSEEEFEETKSVIGGLASLCPACRAGSRRGAGESEVIS